MPETNQPKQFLRLLKPRLSEMLITLRRLVRAESPSYEKRPADRCASILAAEWRRRGARVERLAQRERGDHLRVTWWPQKHRPAGQYLVLGHYDTVYSAGTLQKMPFRIVRAKAYGPGIFDMKAGLVQALFALEAIQRSLAPLRHRLVFLWTSDEEIGSDTSRKFIEAEARRSDAVFVLEPSLGPKGLLKTARKGVGEAEIIVHGRASHAGLAAQEGVNAVHELAQQITRIREWNNPRRGVSVNADVIEGGTRVNVIAERARALLDLRALHAADMRRIEARLRALRPIHRGARLEVHGGFNRAPLEHKRSAALFARAKSLAAQIGLRLGECTAGGGSDGNFTAALGIPTLDGLGAVGHGAHSSDEHILIHAMPARAALLAALLVSRD
ncbi:MAG TPA: M20 family metallopeptidase [Candidatus Methylomirabilis sp.]|nr:M20 family metallopeptidase [Candidatus Methylomirabilis sp.]